MRYSELVQFEPIETVIQIRQANQEEAARNLVKSFVISERMSEQLKDIVFPHLQFLEPADNKGLMIVGNYGTGKSHLMAVISAVCERKELAELLSSDEAIAASSQIAGRFKVIRAEVGSTTMALRDIICGILEQGLSALGVEYRFKSSDKMHENKSAFIEMMSAFEARFPDNGLLLVVDELLDYLKTRKDQELSLDLSFLREIGEVCQGTRFRFLAGLQESLFDSPRFQFVAETLRRVKDRFQQIRIARDDVAYVVSERLLKKDKRQQALIREHLVKFAPMYGSMNEKLDEYVRLFPVHPSYLDTFERVYVAEKREVLKSLSWLIRGLLEKDVPEGEPGLISYDSYWQLLRDNPSFRSDPDIKAVIDKSVVLESRIQQAYTRPQYKPVALRIINALSIHRLTTDDIYSPIGATAAELRDDLCLLLPVPEKEAGFLMTVIESVLKEIIRTVSGQFISFNKENGQYFIDLKKDVDFDSLIEKKAESLDDSQLDRYYFDALRRLVLEDPDAPAYVTGYRIWEYEVEWRERKAGRSGYLFFGAPNERSTAQPPRDFYLYFLQPFDPPSFRDEMKRDEVFFKFKGGDETFFNSIRLYAGAREQAATSSGTNRRIYEEKAGEHLKSITDWLRDKTLESFEVIYEGRCTAMSKAMKGAISGTAARFTLRDYVNSASSAMLSRHFEELSPEYPIFQTTLTRQNREQACQDALRWIAGSIKSKQGTAILDGLELLDGDVLRPGSSKYARSVVETMGKKGQNQVLNRSEMIQSESGIEYWTQFRLEPEFLAVILASLVQSGDIVLSLPGKKIDASSMDSFARLGIAELTSFKHIERPKDLPLGPLQELCETLGIAKGLMTNPATREEAVGQIVNRRGELLDSTVTMQARLGELSLWGKPLMADRELTERREQLTRLKDFLESLQPYNTPGKLKNFPYDSAGLEPLRTGKLALKECQQLADISQQLASITSYLSKAEAILNVDNPWLTSLDSARKEILTKLQSPKHRADQAFHRELGQRLEKLKSEYQDSYIKMHQRSRLGANDDRRKANLAKDHRLAQLQKLSSVEILPSQQLRDFENRFFALKTCFSLTKQDLELDPVCPHCSFRPLEESHADGDSSNILATLEERLDSLTSSWTRSLLENLEDPTVQSALDLLGKEGKAAIKGLVETKELPDPIGANFLKALQEAFTGLQRVTISASDLRSTLSSSGAPCTLKELQERFEKYLAEIARGKDSSKVRIVIEE